MHRSSSGVCDLSFSQPMDLIEVSSDLCEQHLPKHSQREWAITQKILVELYNLKTTEGGKEWVETARWQKYEEDITDHMHFGQPHLPFLSFHALVQLRECLAKGVVLLDLEADCFSTACSLICVEMERKFKENAEFYEEIMGTLSQYKRQVPKMHRKKSCAVSPKPERCLSSHKIAPTDSSAGMRRIKSFIPRIDSTASITKMKSVLPRIDSTASITKVKSVFFSIGEETTEEGYETAQVFSSAMSSLEKAKFAMIRLAWAVKGTDTTAPPIRFIFLLLGPENPHLDYTEIGRCIGTLMSNPGFQEIAHHAGDRKELIYAVDRFLEGSLVLPPGDIRNKDMVDTERIQKELIKRQKEYLLPANAATASAEPIEAPPRDPLKRRGKLFGGLISDFTQRWPYYKSDFTDALNFQTITSIVFIFFACFAPAITFGGLLGSYTKDTLGTMETLMAQCVCGLLWAFLSAQPLLVISATGPVLIFEASLYALCAQLELDFLTVRVWTGIWVLVFTFITVMFDGSVLIKLVSRFTEEVFATLISLIFIVESFNFLKQTYVLNPVKDMMFYWYSWEMCVNETNRFPIDSELADHVTYWESKRLPIHYFTVLEKQELFCFHKEQPDTALLTTILLAATFVLAYLFKLLRSSRLLGRTLRHAVGDFGLLISILIVAFFDFVVFDRVYLERLDIPESIGFTLPVKRGHGVLISWLFPSDRWWGYLFALAPAFLFYILFFVETGITELLLINKNLGLQKGSGFHWDLLLTGFLTLLCSVFGLPWMCASGSHSLALSQSLSVMKAAAPGEKPSVDFVREQRVTVIAVSLLLGACAFAGKFLVYVPLASLFGVLLFFGIMEIIQMVFIYRLILILVPPKYFPNTSFSEKVEPLRVHLFTIIQLICVVIVYLVKHFKTTALCFPLVQLLTCLIRSKVTITVLKLRRGLRPLQKVLPLIFTNEELEALDGHEEDVPEDGFYDLITIPL